MTRKKFENFGGNKYRDTPVTIPNTEVKSVLPMILAWQRAGKAGAAKLKKPRVNRGFFVLYEIIKS